MLVKVGIKHQSINTICLLYLHDYFCRKWTSVIMSSKRSLGDILCLLRFLLHHPDCCRVMYCYATFLFHYYSYSYYYYYYSSTHFCPLYFSEMPWSNFMKPCRNIICHVKLCCIGLIFSKWLPLPWKRPKSKKLKNTKMIIAGYSPNRNWWNLIGKTSTSSGTR